ncbi:alpha/beta hydrolase-fold protein, partial [candidate division KSB1 bacterium]
MIKRLFIITVLFLNLTGLNYSVKLCAQEKDSDIVIGKYDRIFSDVLDEERTIKITLPDDYSNSRDNYPVLYVLDAEWNPFYAKTIGTV